MPTPDQTTGPPALRGSVSSLWLLAAADPTPPIRELVARTIRDLDLQRDLPQVSRPFDWQPHLPDELLWTLAALAAALLLYCLRDLLPGWRGRSGGDWAADGPAATLAADGRQAELDAADALARDGRHAEAIHELLLVAMAQLRERLPQRLADSLTSREILRRSALPEAGDRALRDLVARVEWTWFGERPASAADFEACRQTLGTLLGVLGAIPA